MNHLIRPAKATVRGVGYCVTPECPEFLHLRVQPSAPEHYDCSVCGAAGALELERGIRSGEGPLVSDVRVEFGFDPRRKIYLERVCVRAARLLRPHGVFTLQSPLIQSEAAAHAVASTLLQRLSNVSRLERAPVRIDLSSEGGFPLR